MEIDHSIMIFRDVLNLGRLPVDIYKQPLKSILTFMVPVAIMVTIPSQAFMGMISITGVVVSFIIAMTLIYLAFRFWDYSLKFYSSASS